jgi:hypothetical protein
MAARYLRFVRALALASGAANPACDGAALLKPIADSAPDSVSAPDSDSDSDSNSDSDSDSVSDSASDSASDPDTTKPTSSGLCRTVTADAGPDLFCDAGGACSFPDDAGEPRCTFGVDAAGAGNNLECGGITCGEYCYCAGPAASVCGCLHGAIGPLSPPDLPRLA